MATRLKDAWSQAVGSKSGVEDSVSTIRAAGWTDTSIFVCLVIMVLTLPFPDLTGVREICFFLALIFWIIRITRDKNYAFIRTSLDIPLLLLMAAGLLSIATAVDRSYSFVQVADEIFRGMLVFYLAVHHIRTSARAAFLLGAMILAAVVMDSFAVPHFFMKHGDLTTMIYREAGLHRGFSDLATYLLQTAPFLMLAILFAKKRINKILLALLFAAHMLALYMTFSRAGVVFVIFEAGLIIFFWGQYSKTALACLVLVALLVGLTLPHRLATITRAPSTTEEGSSVEIPGLGVRMKMWVKAWDYIKEKPFTGIGAGRRSFTKKYPEVVEEDRLHWHLHNTLISFTIELGVQGLLIYLYIFYRIIRTLWIRRGRLMEDWGSSTGGVIMGGTLLMVIGFLLRNATDHTFINDFAVFFWLVVGSAFSLKIYNSNEPRQETGDV
ncbi:MAG: O-antigen ligase family protein [Deltaproteobacteria bacterium]|nr:O-antigen ligase family protein [Deltaproteobacteria bacterium]